MPTVVDAARVTTKDNAVWRTCAGCGLLAPVPPDQVRCPSCGRLRPMAEHEATGWEVAHRYAGLLGRIEAWAVLIPGVDDAERLDNIRRALTALASIQQGKREVG